MSTAWHAPQATAPPERSTAQERLSHLAASWRRLPGGGPFVDGLRAWLASLRSQNTWRIYTAAVTTFQDFCEMTFRQSMLPDRVTREHAVQFSAWLHLLPIELIEHRLAREPEGFDLPIFLAV